MAVLAVVFRVVAVQPDDVTAPPIDVVGVVLDERSYGELNLNVRRSLTRKFSFKLVS